MKHTLTALIVDDEALARHLVRDYLRRHEDICVLGECENGAQALQDIAASQPDLIFLDIQMPKLTGLEVLELSGRRKGVIFTTAYDEYALRAFDHHAVDYLLKPFTQARFDEAVQQARMQLQHSLPETLLHHAAVPLTRILIRDREQIIVVPVDSVDCIEAQDDYIAIHTAGKIHLKTQSLSDIETRLDGKVFLRVHRSYLINLQQLKAIERHGKDGHAARLHSGKLVPISRAGYERLLEVM